MFFFFVLQDATFAEASAVCEEDGARLCTKAEIQADCTAGTGCGHDADLIWTGEKCNGDSFEKEMKRAQNLISPKGGHQFQTAGSVRCASVSQGQGKCLSAIQKLSSTKNQPFELGTSKSGQKLAVVVVDVAMNFTQAECFCHEFGGNLLSLHSASDLATLAAAVDASQVRGAVFIGAYGERFTVYLSVARWPVHIMYTVMPYM
jgi:hypothetical protein